MVGVAKKSKDKISIGGRKYALRRRNARGVAEAEVVGIGEPPVDDGDDRSLIVPLVETARWSAARAWTRSASGTPPPGTSCRSRPASSPAGEPVIPTVHLDGAVS